MHDRPIPIIKILKCLFHLGFLKDVYSGACLICTANQREFFYRKSTIWTTVAAIEANNDTYCFQKRREKFPLARKNDANYPNMRIIRAYFILSSIMLRRVVSKSCELSGRCELVRVKLSGVYCTQMYIMYVCACMLNVFEKIIDHFIPNDLSWISKWTDVRKGIQLHKNIMLLLLSLLSRTVSLFGMSVEMRRFCWEK